MSVFDAVKSAIETVSAVTGRVYHAEALKNASAPFVFWLQDGESFEQALDGYTELGKDSYEIHIVTKNLASLNEISAAVRTAVTALQGQTVSGIIYERMDMSQVSPVINEHEVNLYRKVYSLAINYQEE